MVDLIKFSEESPSFLNLLAWFSLVESKVLLDMDMETYGAFLNCPNQWLTGDID